MILSQLVPRRSRALATPAPAAPASSLARQRPAETGAQTAKPRLRHADDGERIAVQANGVTKNVRITAEALAPVAIRSTATGWAPAC